VSQHVTLTLTCDADDRVALSLRVPGWRRLTTLGDTLEGVLRDLLPLVRREEREKPIRGYLRHLKIRRLPLSPLQGKVSRQRITQVMKIQRGECAHCPRRRTTYALVCDACMAKRRVRDGGGKPWRPGGPGRPPKVVALRQKGLDKRSHHK
jgi:hypothetical protein